jgi:hypothetical protein
VVEVERQVLLVAPQLPEEEMVVVVLGQALVVLEL